MKNEIQDNREVKPEPVAEKKDFQQPPAATKKAVQKPMKLNNLDDVYSFAKKLRKYITDNNLSVNIQGREYAYVDGWKFALVSFGLVPIVSKPERVDGGKVAYIFSRWQEFTKKGVKDRKLVPYFAGTNEQIAEIQRKKYPPDHEHVAEYFAYRCDCDLKNMATGEIVGTGTALCTNIESKKTGFDEYAVLSMAQTRAIGKAARNLIGFVMNHAGLESTPAEEMEPLVDPMMPPTGNQDGPENSGDPYADIKIVVSDCKTLQELSDLWDKYPENHKDKIFQQIVKNKKIQLTTPQK